MYTKLHTQPYILVGSRGTPGDQNCPYMLSLYSWRTVPFYQVFQRDVNALKSVEQILILILYIHIYHHLIPISETTFSLVS
jgi:hypothetical protein